MRPWNDWYHVMGNTYGTWLPGSPKGFRTEMRKLHVPYDYKHPPPKGEYEKLHEYAKSVMARPPVYLESREQRRRAVDELVRSLLRHDIPVAIGSVDRIHFHILAPFKDLDPRRWVGLAKKESSHYCKQAGLAPEGGLWADGTECKPVKGPAHHENAFGYIADHAERGAELWRYDKVPPLWDFDPDGLRVD
jgi:hypothetical protein